MILIRTSIELIQIVTHLLTICEHYNNAVIKSHSSNHHPRPRLLAVDVIGLLRALVIWGPLKISRRILNKSADSQIRPPYVILASMWIWNVIQYLSRASFSIQFPNRAPVVIYTDCGAVNFITRTKNSLSYQIEIFMIHWPPFAGHICKYSRCNYLKRKIFFWQKFFFTVIQIGPGTQWAVWHNRVWLGGQYWWLVSLRILSLVRDSHSVSLSLCVQCQVSIILSQECKLFQSSVLTMFNGQVSCLVESDGRVQYWQQVICGDWAEHSASMTLISANMQWLARDHTSQTDCSDHTQHCSASEGSLDICSKVLTEDYNSANIVGSCMRSAYPGCWCCREQEDIPAECELELIGNMGDVLRVTQSAGHVATKCIPVSPNIARGNCGL